MTWKALGPRVRSWGSSPLEGEMSARRAAIRRDIRERRSFRRLWARTLDDATISLWVRGIARRELEGRKRLDRQPKRVRGLQ